MPDLKQDRRHRNQISDEHEELSFRLTQFREVLARRKINPLALLDCIDALSDVVNTHFAHEEVGGYFEQIVERVPHLLRKVEALKQQHQAFRQSLAELHGLANKDSHSPKYWERLEMHFQDFWERFGEHERTENALLQETYERDMGDSD
jgi:hypothetical protein